MDNDKAQAIKQLEDSIAINKRVIRVLKGGYFPANVSGDVQPSIDYFKRLNKMWEMQISQIKNPPKLPKEATPLVEEKKAE